LHVVISPRFPAMPGVQPDPRMNRFLREKAGRAVGLLVGILQAGQASGSPRTWWPRDRHIQLVWRFGR
jgi:hypothetical protein